MPTYLLKKVYKLFDYFFSEDEIYHQILVQSIADTAKGIRFIYPFFTITMMYLTYSAIQQSGMSTSLGLIEGIGLLLLIFQQMIHDPALKHDYRIVLGIGYISLSYVLFTTITIIHTHYLSIHDGRFLFFVFYLMMPLFILDQFTHIYTLQSILSIIAYFLMPQFGGLIIFLLTVVGMLIYTLYANRCIDLYLERIYISQQHSIDGLTRVMTKKSGIHAMDHLLSNNEPGVLFVFDIDNFKQFNDQYGHSYGDQVLQKASTAIRSSFRRTDIIMRYGGDEFVVYMRNGTFSSATEKVKQIEKAIHKLSSEDQREITFSIGIALHSDHISFKDLFNQADQALYYVKKSTKHNYMFYSPALSHQS